MALEKYRGRVHMILLYPDNESHMEALSKIQKLYDYAGIKHDRDVWTEADAKLNPEHKAGEYKKEHIHIVLRTGNNAVWNTALCKDLGIEEKFCEQAKNTVRALQYLIHYNDTDKVQYTTDEVFGTMKSKLMESLQKDEKSEGEKVLELIDYIEEQNNPISIRRFASYCASNGYWSEFRRSATIFLKVIEEHNVFFRDSSRHEAGSYEDAKSIARFEGYVQGHQDGLKDKSLV